jgi:NhaA family Na+:H+ antiporter
MLFSGIHATLAGVVLAMMIPIESSGKDRHSLLHGMERALSPWVAFLVLPIFGFANAGVSINAAGNMSLLSPLGLGIVGGLFFGKQIGIVSAVYLAKKARIAALPAGADWRQIYGVAVLCGIGFTMSLFIGLLAFSAPETEAVLKLSVLVGSLLSALVGALVLLTVAPAKSTHAT